MNTFGIYPPVLPDYRNLSCRERPLWPSFVWFLDLRRGSLLPYVRILGHCGVQDGELHRQEIRQGYTESEHLLP